MSRLTKNVSTLILAGGRGERLFPLTKYRAKPAVPFGGGYRIIDFTLSNCINSGIRRINILTQYKSKSLARHVKMGWNLLHSEIGEYIDLLPAQKRVSDSWYLGTADAVYQNLYTLEREGSDYVLILAGDHVYKMDYTRMLEFHVEKRADATIGVVEMPIKDSENFGVVQVDGGDGVEGFEEKPKAGICIPGKTNRIYASMGIYVFNTEVLFEELIRDTKRGSDHDFGKNVLPEMLGRRGVCAYRFVDGKGPDGAYWRDIGTLEAYYLANMELVSTHPRFNLYDQDWPIRSYQPQVPPARIAIPDDGESVGDGRGLDAVISNGCVINGGRVTRSVLSPGVRVNSRAIVEGSVLMDGVEVGRYAEIRNSIIDKHVTIPAGVSVGCDLEQDRKRYTVTPSGIVVVAKGMTIASPGDSPHRRGLRPNERAYVEKGPCPTGHHPGVQASL